MKEALELFNKYYENFNSDLYGVHMKYDHTMRVVEYAEQIAKSLGLNEEDYDLAARCALFHDISRFKQWQEYNTFEDERSFDHGDEGYNILKDLGVNDEIILLSTKYHNKYKVADDVDDRTKLFCDITRDADKLDIMDTQAKMFKDESIDITDEVMDCFTNHTLLKNGCMGENLSLYPMLRCLAFIFDLNFKESLKIVKDKNIVNAKCDEILSKIDNEDIRKIKDILNTYIDERVK